MKNALFFLFVLLLPFLSWGQMDKQNFNETAPINAIQPIKVSLESTTKELMAELDGSFRVETVGPDYQVLYTKELLETIKSSRKNTEEVRLAWDNNNVIIVISPLIVNSNNLENKKTRTNE